MGEGGGELGILAYLLAQLPKEELQLVLKENTEKNVLNLKRGEGLN